MHQLLDFIQGRMLVVIPNINSFRGHRRATCAEVFSEFDRIYKDVCHQPSDFSATPRESHMRASAPGPAQERANRRISELRRHWLAASSSISHAVAGPSVSVPVRHKSSNVSQSGGPPQSRMKRSISGISSNQLRQMSQALSKRPCNNPSTDSVRSTSSMIT